MSGFRLARHTGEHRFDSGGAALGIGAEEGRAHDAKGQAGGVLINVANLAGAHLAGDVGGDANHGLAVASDALALKGR